MHLWEPRHPHANEHTDSDVPLFLAAMKTAAARTVGNGSPHTRPI